MLDLILKNGTVVDGTGKPRFQADVGVKDGVITAVGNLDGQEAKEVLDIAGLCVSSGFVDWHSHSDLAVLADLDAFNILEQGITFEITGHCGVSLEPYIDPKFSAVGPYISEEQKKNILEKGGTAKAVFEEIAKQKLPTNMAFYMGHGNIRGNVMGYDNRKPTDEELEKMKALVREGMEAGAMGLSTGLIYPPGSYSQPEEIEALCSVVAEYPGSSYTSHMRSEGNGVIESVKETIHVAETCGIPVFISHHKIAGRHNEGKSKETLRLIEEANQRGLKVGLDQYPYDGGATSLLSAMPPKYASKGLDKLVEMLHDPAIRAEIREQLMNDSDEYENLIYGSTPAGVIVAPPSHPELTGKTVAEIAEMQNKDPYEVIFDLLCEDGAAVGAIYRMICPWDIENIMKYPRTMVGIDGAHSATKEKMEHPRGVATYPYILGTYVREKGLLTLEQAIRKMTGLAAEVGGFTNKGTVEAGKDADFVVFDADTIAGPADYCSADVDNIGIKYVFVNGVMAVKDGKCTGARGGKMIFRPNPKK